LRDIDLKSLWTRTAKKLKTASTSTPIQQTVESRVQSNSPSIHLEAHAENEVEPEPAEPEVASTEPQVVGDVAVAIELM
jgi:hypothetical protein